MLSPDAEKWGNASPRPLPIDARARAYTINNINTRLQTDRARQRRSPAWRLFTKVRSSLRGVDSQAIYLVDFLMGAWSELHIASL